MRLMVYLLLTLTIGCCNESAIRPSYTATCTLGNTTKIFHHVDIVENDVNWNHPIQLVLPTGKTIDVMGDQCIFESE